MARITCGHCGDTHTSVAAVRDCFEDRAAWADLTSAVAAAEDAFERSLETSDVVRWETEQDDRRAALATA